MPRWSPGVRPRLRAALLAGDSFGNVGALSVGIASAPLMRFGVSKLLRRPSETLSLSCGIWLSLLNEVLFGVTLGDAPSAEVLELLVGLFIRTHELLNRAYERHHDFLLGDFRSVGA
jgi:hypothetical protein